MCYADRVGRAHESLTTYTRVFPTGNVTETRIVPSRTNSRQLSLTDWHVKPTDSLWIVYNALPAVVMIHREGESVKDEKDKGDATAPRPNKWAFIAMPFVVAAIGAVVGGAAV